MAIVSVIVDDRETWTRSLTFGGAPVEVERIDTDVLILADDGILLGFERKESSDFLNTLRADRLFPQLEKLHELTPWAYLVICGELRPGPNGRCLTERDETGWTWASVSGALLACQEVGIHVVQCHATDFEAAVMRIANRQRKPMRVRPAREISVMSEGETVLSALPGIGPDKAETLMKYCGSAAWAFHFLTDDSFGGSVPSIGDGIKRKVRRALGLEDWAILCPIDRSGNPRNGLPKDIAI